ncbi:MAG: CDP-diacylglycerol--serine O-phosphatidyltransferase [Candidatus Aminicenantales bacterium]|jgi:CDP-diacylglycerol--serine O-phosphatidyltransferase
MKTKKLHKGIYLVPSLFTLTNLFFGFMSILLTYHGRYRMAALWIVVAALMDGMDGLVARAMKAPSDFGIELDSLSDAVSFGLATSVLLYFWGMKLAGPPAIFFSFLFLTAGVLRLARYNIRTKSLPDRKHYQGLTVPSAAIFMGSLVIFHPAPLETRELAIGLIALTFLVALCMVSTFPYRNYTKVLQGRRIDILTALLAAVSIAGLIFYPRVALLVLTGLNVLSGPATVLARAGKKGLKRKPAAKENPS